MHRLMMLRLCTLALLFLAAPQARADLISWSYDWSFSTDQVKANAGSGDHGKILLLAGGLHHAAGSSDIAAINLKTVSNASASDPAKFTDRPYSLILFIRDQQSGLRGAVTFSGVFSGTLSAHSASIKNLFTSPTTEMLHLGHHIYTITVGHFSPPGPPNSPNLGGIGAHVSVSNNPEPSALVLAGVGVPLFGLMLRRRRKAGPAH